MGYRSDGAFALRKQCYDQAKVLDIKLPEILESMDKTINHAWVIWEYNSYKMHDSYPEVAELNEFMDNMDDEDVPWAKIDNKDTADCYQYIRIGEETEDIEERGYYGCLYIDRSIGVY